MDHQEVYADDVIDLRQLGAALRRRVWVVVAGVVLAVSASWIFTRLQTPIYEATTVVLIKDLSTVGEHLFLDGGGQASQRNRVQNSVQLLRSRQVSERAEDKLRLQSGVNEDDLADLHQRVNVQPVTNTETVRITVAHPDRNFAAMAANAVAGSFIEFSQELNRAEVTAAREFIEEQLVLAEAELRDAEQLLLRYRETAGTDVLADETRALIARHAEIDALLFEATMAHADAERRGDAGEMAEWAARMSALQEQSHIVGDRLAALPATEITLARLTREQTVLEQSFLLLRRRLEDARIAEAMRSPDVAVIDRALPPKGPVSPRPLLNLALGTFLGLFVGLGAALILEYFDTTLKTPDEVESVLGLPVIGRIPFERTRDAR